MPKSVGVFKLLGSLKLKRLVVAIPVKNQGTKPYKNPTTKTRRIPNPHFMAIVLVFFGRCPMIVCQLLARGQARLRLATKALKVHNGCRSVHSNPEIADG